MMYAKEMNQLNNAMDTAFADGKLSGSVRFSILQFHFFVNETDF